MGNINTKGEYINLIIVNKKYSEGISLKNMRICHILEPPETLTLKDQIIGRNVRDCSHKDLNYKDWNVKIYTYFSNLKEKNENNNQKINLQNNPEKEFEKIIEQQKQEKL